MSSIGPERACYVLLGLCGCALLVLFETLALREYFRNDDWFFLRNALSPAFSWQDAFFPVGTTRPFAIRPLGEVGFMRVGHALFGYEAFGYYQISLLAHLIRGAALYAIARRLGVDAPIAAATALLVLSRIPTLSLVWVAVGFAYILAAACSALGVLSFIRGIQGGRAAWYLASLAILAVGLATHEVSVTLPAVYASCSLALDRDPVISRRLRSAFLRTLPSALLVLGYLAVRLLVVAPIDDVSGGYALRLDPAVMRRTAWVQGFFLLGSEAALWGLLGGSALLLVWLASRPGGRRGLKSRYLPLAAIGLVWLAAALAPIVGLSMGALRRSVPIEAPVCLLVGGLLDLLVRELGPARRRAALVVIALLVALSIPWQRLVSRLDEDAPRFARHFVEMVERERDRFGPGAQLVLLYGHPDLADADDLRLFEIVTYGGSIVGATLPGRNVRYVKQDLASPIEAVTLAPDSIYVLAEPGLSGFRIAADDRVARHLVVPALRQLQPPVFRRAVRQALRLRGAEAVDVLVRACRARARRGFQDEEQCRAAVVAALPPSHPASRGVADALRR